ncbi:ATP synthase mitochondrial F1 complex assembly factor 2-like [Dendronephthya gigantea]|uniref:ATP synthase mitochondrial F1 complex assembly factor 2-like n=1 Tax=Dendronephthya gigantea TaxID=151771 RepID=UPI00106CC34F|nr:ATP synthase mitochondrial F1 complex assembly factor 2-like [Dendronephthya gigantea]
MSSVLFRGFSLCLKRSLKPQQVSNCCRRHLSSFRDRKRFYNKVDVVETKNGYQITLDNKTVKTPHGQHLCVPYQPLAAALSVEWDAQEEVIKPEFMHLTALTNTVIDDPLGKKIESRVHEILEYLLTDTVCFLSDEPEELFALQKQEWGPLWSWFDNRFNVSLSPTSSLLVEISPQLRDTMQDYITSFNKWSLTGFEYAVESAKSLVIACALAEKEISVEKAASLSRLEVEFQIQKWGNVEWAHEVDLMDLRSRLAAATLFFHLTSGSTLDSYKD